MTLPVTPVKIPNDLFGQSNGELSGTLLTLCGIKNFKMHHLASRAMRAMLAAAPFDKSSTGTYRTLAQQVQLFTERYQTTPLPGRPTKIWHGVTYWQKPNTAMAAVPGTSNHGFGLAIDFSTDLIDFRSFVDWLTINAITYGYSAETQSEPWHWRYVSGDNLPQAVINFENGDEDMMEKIQVPGDAAIFIRDGGNCTWASDTEVTKAWEAQGLIQPSGVVRSVDRIFLKGLTFYGKTLPNNNVTVESDFGLWIKS